MIIMKKCISDKYTYENFLENFNIGIEVFERFNSTEESRRKKLDTSISRMQKNEPNIKRNSIKIDDKFNAIFQIKNVRGKDKVYKMDFLHGEEYLYKDVTAQTFIFATGIILNARFHKEYDYATINEFYKAMRERKDSSKSINDSCFREILKELSILADEIG